MNGRVRTFELSHIGEFHVNHNEDFLVLEDLGEDLILVAVMDGCSSGTDSHFASTLIGKILRKLAKQEAYREYATNERKELVVLLESISLQLFDDLSNLNRQLDLKSDEILSTLILGVVDKGLLKAEMIVVGDGMIHIDGENIEYENDNKPDYIGYHLNMDKHLWYQTRAIKKSIPKFKDLTISTDGIHTFKNHDGKSYPKITEERIMEEFFVNTRELDNANKLKKTLITISEEYGLKPSDDLTMIRVVFF